MVNNFKKSDRLTKTYLKKLLTIFLNLSTVIVR